MKKSKTFNVPNESPLLQSHLSLQKDVSVLKNKLEQLILVINYLEFQLGMPRMTELNDAPNENN
jgi:hypothetical protein